MIKILILSRSSLFDKFKNTPQEELKQFCFTVDDQIEMMKADYAIFQEGDGPVTVLKDRSDYPIKTLLEEVIREMK